MIKYINKWGCRDKSPMQKIPNHINNLLSYRKREHYSSLLKCVLYIPSKECSMEKGEKRVTLQWRNLTNTTLARQSRSTSTVISHVDSMYHDMM